MLLHGIILLFCNEAFKTRINLILTTYTLIAWQMINIHILLWEMMLSGTFCPFLWPYRKPAVVIKHSGLDESGDSNGSEDFDLPVNTNGHVDITRLPKGWS